MFAEALARMEGCGDSESVVGLSIPGWLAERTRGSSRSAKRMLRAGRTLVRFSGHNAATVRHIIETEVKRQLVAASAEKQAGVPMPSVATLRARAFAELLLAGNRATPGSSAAPRTDAVVVVRDGDFSDVHGEALDPRTAAVLACDSFLHHVVIDADGAPMFLGRTSRLASLPQRRTLIACDGGCVFPGCDLPASRCDAHHVLPWEEGGTTDIVNLAIR